MTDSSRTYLVTGITGFLGRHVVEAVGRDDPSARLVGLVRDSAAAARLDYLGGVELLEGDTVGVSDWENHPTIDGLSGIFHLAGEVRHSRSHVEHMMEINVAGPAAMVRLAALKKCRLVFVSSSGTVGCSTNPEYSPDESAPFCEEISGRWPYYLSKILAERESRALAKRLDADLVIVRPPVMLGPGDHRGRSTSNVMRVLENRLPFVLKGGMHFADIRDIATAMVAAMHHRSPQPVYHLPGTASTLNEFFERVARVAGIRPRWKQLPGKLIRVAARLNEITGHRSRILPDPVVIEMAQHYWGLSSIHAERDLGYRSRDPDVTIADTIEWLRR